MIQNNFFNVVVYVYSISELYGFFVKSSLEQKFLFTFHYSFKKKSVCCLTGKGGSKYNLIV